MNLNSKWIKDHNLNPDTLICAPIYRHRKALAEPDADNTGIKTNNHKQELMKLKGFYVAVSAVIQVNRQPTE